MWAAASSSTTNLNNAAAPTFSTQSASSAPPQQRQQQQQQQQQSTGLTPSSAFSIQYYSQYFDIDTIQVIRRCLIALNPFTSAKFFASFSEDDIDYNSASLAAGASAATFDVPPDLYGPFWIATTVIFALFFSSSLTGVFYATYKGTKYEYQFDLLTGAATILYSYTFIWPPVLWFIASYALKMNTAGVGPSISQFLCLFGYSNIIWIPVAVLAVSPLAGAFPRVADLVRWIVVVFGYLFSATFLAKNLKPVFVPREAPNVIVDKKQGYFLLALVCLLHVAVCIAIKYLFFGSLKQVEAGN